MEAAAVTTSSKSELEAPLDDENENKFVFYNLLDDEVNFIFLTVCPSLATHADFDRYQHGLRTALRKIREAEARNADMTTDLLLDWHRALSCRNVQTGGRFRATDSYQEVAATPRYYMPAASVTSAMNWFCFKVGTFLKRNYAKVYAASMMERYHMAGLFFHGFLEIAPFREDETRTMAWLFVKWFLGRLPDAPIRAGNMFWCLYKIGAEAAAAEAKTKSEWWCSASQAQQEGGGRVKQPISWLFTKDTTRMTRLFARAYESSYLPSGDKIRAYACAI
jgi:hypothetical protein